MERNTFWNRQLQKGYIDMAKPLVGFSQGYKEIPEYKGKKLCKLCAYSVWFEEQFKDSLKEGRRQVIIVDLVQSADGVLKHIQSASQVAEKYGYIFKSESHSVVFGGGISTMMFFEKVITTADETKFVNCRYCKTRYDANQFFKCPNCGSPTTNVVDKIAEN